MRTSTNKILSLIGDTPMVPIGSPNRESANIFGKLECYNPGSSVKDRIALSMISTAEEEGLLRAGMTIVEPTSGNTGIGLAIVGKKRGYNVVLTMPESMSVERRKLLRSLGAQLVLTDGKDGMHGALAEAEALAEKLGAFMPRQFENPANPLAHYQHTGPEIWRMLDGKVDVLVAGVGTGGTISGAGKYLKELNPSVHVVAVEPTESAVISGEAAGPHMIQGIGAGFIPKTLDVEIIDEVVKVASADAIETAKQLAKEDCLLVGISSGAAVAAAIAVGKQKRFWGKNVVAILPDTAERYASTLLFYED